MKSLARRDRIDTPDWTQRVGDMPDLGRLRPFKDLVEDLQLRYGQRVEELPGVDPSVSIRWLQSRLVEAFEAASDLDEWIPTAEAASMVRVSDQTIRNRIADGVLDREPGPNGGYLVHRGQVLEAFGLGSTSQKQDLAA